MSISISETINLKDKLKSLLAEPTLDRAYSTAASILLSAAIVKVFIILLIPPEFIDYVWITFMFLVSFLCMVIAFFYRKFDQDTRDTEHFRKISLMKEKYLIEHKHLDKTEIRLDALEILAQEMEQLKELFEHITKGLVNHIRKEDEATKKEEDESSPPLPL